MKCQAAVLRGVGKQWEFCEIRLGRPKEGEVLVKMAVAGICHSDDHFATGDTTLTPELEDLMRASGMAVPEAFPFLGGHEGAGVVAEVGRGVRSVAPGDHVAMSFIPACGRCRFCVSGMTYLCDLGAGLYAKEMVTDGTARRHAGDEALMAMAQLGTFAEYAVVAEQSLVRIADDVPFHAAALVSCGVTTGWGSATVAAGTEPGDTVVVIGTGGVGMNALQGARSAGAKFVVGVDPVAFKRDSAMSFGATHTASSVFEAIPLVRELTAGVMADRVVITAGVVHPDLIAPALMLTRKGGTAVLTGIVPYDESVVPVMLSDMILSHKRLQGALYGGMNPQASTPMLLSMYQQGRLKLDELVTRRYGLDQLNEAIDDMREGRIIRGVIEFA